MEGYQRMQCNPRRTCERNVIQKAQTLGRSKYHLLSKRQWTILGSMELRFNRDCPQMFFLYIYI